MADISSQWDATYRTKADEDTSWFVSEPNLSLRLVQSCADRRDAFVDIGAGRSLLAHRLWAIGWRDITVLDVSRVALDQLREKFDSPRDDVVCVAQDVISWQPDRHYRVWHDRATFHFLTDDDQRAAYVATATSCVDGGGHAVIATFGLEGPSSCSGRPVRRYAAESLADVFRAGFELVGSEHEDHVTPMGTVQPFTWVILRRQE